MLSLASLTSLTLITFFYFIFLSSVLFYLLPISKNLANFVAFKKTNVNFEYITSFDFYSLITLPFFLSTIVFFNWTAPLSSAWFGNLLISSLQIKISYFYFAFTLSLLFCLTSFIYFNSREVYDFFLVLLNFLFWIILIFFSNNIFSLIFIVEITSTLIFLIFITSTFSSTYFYSNLSLTIHNYFGNHNPLFFIQAIIFFFWTSLISSLNLFLSLMFIYLKFFSFEWNLIENVFFYIINTSSLRDILFLNFIWYNLLFCFFLKCGLAPFYYWKPTFFKGLPFHFLFIYIVLFYFFLLIFILILFLFYLNEIFYFFMLSNSVMTLVGFFFFFFILTESFYIKSFLAMSSILNTIFIFITINSTSFNDFFFFL